MSDSFVPPGDCPVCGEFVPRGAAACRECGSCAKTGWNEDSAYDHLDLPEEAFEDEDAPPAKKPVGSGVLESGIWRWVALAILLGGALLWLLAWR